jgi:hypothetical protein
LLNSLGLNKSATPLRLWGFWQCLPFSWTTLRGKDCRHTIAVMGVVEKLDSQKKILCFFGDSSFATKSALQLCK